MEDSNGALQIECKSLLVGEGKGPLMRNDGEQVIAEEILKGKIVGLYFSAHWCGPCRRFTPKLAEVYKEINSRSNDPRTNPFEVVFVSDDTDEESFKKYFSEMPWLAVPYSDENTRKQLKNIFKVKGIPCLIILDEDFSGIRCSDAVGLVFEHESEAFPFTKQRVQELKEMEEELRRNQTLTSLLTTSTRDYVVSSDGFQVPISTLEGKMTAIYFSQYRYTDCQEFAPFLAKMYSELKQLGKPFEVVLIPLDREEEDFKKHTKDIPWLTLPFQDKSVQKLLRYFELRTIPTLVLIGADGKTVNENIATLVEEHGIGAYPFSPEKMAEIAEIDKRREEEQTLETILVSGELDYVVGRDNNKVLVKELVGKIVLIYFSAHWCGPCRRFTPKLVEVYNELKSKNCEVEVVFASSDRDESSFEEYYSTMPWLALPFGDKRKSILSRKFKVQGIPTLVAIGTDGRTITTKARDLLMEHGADAFPFTEDQIKKLDAAAEELAKSWPDKLKHKLHEHELLKKHKRGWMCDACHEGGKSWAYTCSECDFDLHPDCAFVVGEGEEREGGGGEEKDEAIEKEGEKPGHVCDGEVCHKL